MEEASGRSVVGHGSTANEERCNRAGEGTITFCQADAGLPDTTFFIVALSRFLALVDDARLPVEADVTG
jgi:hypothetical protein